MTEVTGPIDFPGPGITGGGTDASLLTSGTLPIARIADGAVTLAKQANLAANSIQGNNTGSPATPIALTTTQVRALIQSRFLLAQWGVPVIIPSTGSIGNNGALTGITALPTTFANCYMYFPANAIVAGSAAGVYYVQMSSTTAGTIFNNVLAAGSTPAIIASPTAFVTTGPGAFTQTTASALALVTLSIPAGALGANGAFVIDGFMGRPNNANTVTATTTLGGSLVGTYGAVSNVFTHMQRTIRNMASQAVQCMFPAGTSNASDATNTATAMSFTAINTANAANLAFTGNLVTAATDFFILYGVSVIVDYAL